ncbi:hypothetical protein [Sandaracinus amylolyticus]|uniref:Uncharacterized protein n=1 Tax=Sandaracinus amylolyticus TaxID=927083 RepID=A0A0F6YPQ2_9BACT|nr:hypothetical protein [Sandaracinus amylolyticus]AKF11707.1 hypothetical protein DB32_008856 [Sandaracinus amylolyticus]
MSSAVEALVVDEEVSAPSRGRVAEFLLTGGITLLLFPLSWLLRAHVGLDASELAFGFLFFHAAHVINDPHFAVTYLLFYDDVRERVLGASIPRAQRIRYVIAGFVVPLVLVTWAGAAMVLRSAQSLGWMVQLMFVLVGWHYVKQGFGVLTVLSMRRGVRFDQNERRVILAHCYAAWIYAWASPSTPAGEFVEKGVVYWAMARPAWLELVSAIALAITTVPLVIVLARRWRTLPLAPLSGFLVTVWAWTVWSNADPLVRYAIPALHAVQYFYFVALMRGNRARAEEAPPTLGRPVALRLGLLALSALALGWLLFRGGPALLDDGLASDGPLGPTPFFAAFFVVVNVHHYFMDHVIWRRENPEARWLR